MKCCGREECCGLPGGLLGGGRGLAAEAARSRSRGALCYPWAEVTEREVGRLCCLGLSSRSVTPRGTWGVGFSAALQGRQVTWLPMGIPMSAAPSLNQRQSCWFS